MFIGMYFIDNEVISKGILVILGGEGGGVEYLEPTFSKI